MFLRNLFWIEWKREIRRQCQLATSPELFGRVCFIDLIRFDSWFSRDFELKERKLVVGIIFDRFREFFQTRISNPFSAYFRAWSKSLTTSRFSPRFRSISQTFVVFPASSLSLLCQHWRYFRALLTCAQYFDPRYVPLVYSASVISWRPMFEAIRPAYISSFVLTLISRYGTRFFERTGEQIWGVSRFHATPLVVPSRILQNYYRD